MFQLQKELAVKRLGPMFQLQKELAIKEERFEDARCGGGMAAVLCAGGGARGLLSAHSRCPARRRTAVGRAPSAHSLPATPPPPPQRAPREHCA